MKSKFLLAIATLFITTSLFSQDRSFKSMGYDDESITGVTGSISYFIKIKPDDNVDQSRLVINFRASQVLNPNNSFVVVYMKETPVFTQRVIASAIDTSFSIVVPLNSKFLQPDGRFIKIRIAAKMSIGDEYCRDIDNPACWITVKNSSYVESVGQGGASYQRSLKEWIQEYGSVYTPASSDLDDLSAGGLLYAILKQGSSSTSKDIYTAMYNPQDSLPGGIIVGVQDKLPFSVKTAMPQVSAGQGLISLVRVNTGFSEKTVMVVTGADAAGYRKAINLLASNKRLSSSFSEKILINEGISSSVSVDNPSPLVTTLEDLGGDPGLMEGIGALRKKYTFSLSEFNAIPNKLTFHIESYFSTLKPDDRGFINVYLNQNLVYNASLLDKPNFINDIELKPYLLTKFNTLEVEFRFHPGTNVCKDGFSNFFAFVNVKGSNLTFAGEKENKFFSFFNFPAEFRKTPTKIVVSPGLLSSNLVASVGEIYYQLNTPYKNDYNKMIVPQIISSDKASDISGYNIIALLQRSDAYIKNFQNLPVSYEKDWQIYKDLKGQVNYSVNDFSGSGMAQIFKEKGSTILVVTALGDSSAKGAFYSVVKNFSTQLTEIESNVCVANSNGLSNYFFKAPDDNTVVSYKGDKSKLSFFWDNYKYLILGLILILILLSFFFVRNRVRRSQESIQA